MKRYAIAFAVLLVTFVVVCPVTPTPIAVVGLHGPGLHAVPVLATAVFLVSAPVLTAWSSAPREQSWFAIDDVLRLTCVRLC